jgi:hypothetical protein
MCRALEAARDILKTARPEVSEWKKERAIRKVSSSSLDVPSRKQVLLDRLDVLTGCSRVLEGNVEDVIRLVDQWPENRLDEVRSRVQDLAEPVVTRGEDSA